MAFASLGALRQTPFTIFYHKMLYEHIKLVTIYFKVASYFNTMTVSWDPHLLQLTFKRFKGTFRFKSKVRVYLLTLWIIACGNFYFSTASNSLEKSLLIFELITMTGLLIHINTFATHTNELCLYINGLIGFKKDTHIYQKHVFAEYGLLDKLNILYIIPPFAVVMPISFVYGMHLTKPCKASLLGYWMLPECYKPDNSLGYLEITLRTVLILYNHFLWLKTASIAPADLGGVIILGCLTLRDNFKL